VVEATFIRKCAGQERVHDRIDAAVGAGQRQVARVLPGGVGGEAAAWTTRPATSLPGRHQAGGRSSRNVSPRLTENASTRTSASPGSGTGWLTTPNVTMSGPWAGSIAFMGTFHLAAGQGIQQPAVWFDNHMDLDLAQVRAFVAVADEGHFGRAADLLSVSQQGLSKRIARLEAGLGVRLLDRGTHGVTLTEAGRRFLVPARRPVAAGDIAAAAAAGRNGRSGSTCGGISSARCGPSSRFSIMPPACGSSPVPSGTCPR
jgi:hypothetical protein